MTARSCRALVALALATVTCAAGLAQSADPPAQLGALSPENIAKPRPKAPFDMTGTWQHELRGPQSWKFVPPMFELTPEAQVHYDAGRQAAAENKVYRDDIGQCWPAGMPLIMTRVHPFVALQQPTAIFMIQNFMNSLRIIYTDGREHSDPDIVVPSWNGESIGRWEGDTLVVHTTYFETDNHYIDLGIPISDQFELTERIKLVNEGKTMEVEYTLVDPQMWQGEWKSTKRYNRQDYTDINEAVCILQYNANLPGTNLGSQTAEERGQSSVEGVADDE